MGWIACARRSFKVGRLGEPDFRTAGVSVASSLFSMGVRRALGSEVNGIATVGFGWALRLVALAKG